MAASAPGSIPVGFMVVRRLFSIILGISLLHYYVATKKSKMGECVARPILRRNFSANQTALVAAASHSHAVFVGAVTELGIRQGYLCLPRYFDSIDPTARRDAARRPEHARTPRKHHSRQLWSLGIAPADGTHRGCPRTCSKSKVLLLLTVFRILGGKKNDRR